MTPAYCLLLQSFIMKKVRLQKIRDSLKKSLKTFFARKSVFAIVRHFNQGKLTEGEGSVQSTSLYQLL